MNQFDNSVAKEFDLRSLSKLIKKRLWLVILITVVFTGVGWTYTELNNMSPKYEASTNVIIDAEAEYRNTLQVVIKDITVLETVIRELGLDKSTETLAKQVRVESLEDTQVVKISVVDTNPESAADIANTTAKVFIKKVPSVLDINGVSVLSEAKVNSKPMQNNGIKILLAAFLLGAVTGLGLIFIMDYFDSTIKSEREIEQLLGTQVLGSVSKKQKGKIISWKKPKRELNFRSETIGIR
ncbi:Wzz/FepE/Etk N-terminal domain-containing protein [Siminovitchia fortis]|uniref:Capsular biosynthesis protein n=1 Tax=Siminovitchia fortis TaxID=254758 RepID=A0A443IPV2_9BACI|nr:Wzz/FepE/Etk N-terminal domain-containing protein [Siminovitchia fortis]RWR07853.1 capsular biosynthesis protein [Siminovitchia fortis]WHY80524.1 Wzz/FepE/Etk N-terminal domain-containing protein [Siminovitchia fortis]